MAADQIANLVSAGVGDKVKFAEERLAYTIRARGSRYVVCTKPFNPRKTVLYTVVDLAEGVRGTENLIFGAGAETDEQCAEMLCRLEGRDGELGLMTQVSHRSRVPLKVERVTHDAKRFNGQPLADIAALEREQFGDPDKHTGIYAARAGWTAGAKR